ncbi:MAG: hypothetical protein ACO25B_04190 [Chitinophagaceae bacterium]
MVSEKGPHAIATGIKPEVLNSGFIDIVSTGQMNASARIIRLFIGEPGRFAIPLSFYSGVSSNNFQSPQLAGGQLSNEQLFVHFINPMSGLVNISADGIIYFGARSAGLTRWGIVYQFGVRILSAYRSGMASSPFTGKPLNFLNGFGTTGLYFQTGAWERNNARNLGLFWATVRYIAAKSGKNQLMEILPSIQTKGLYHGWSLAWGITINKLVDIKVIYYRYIKKPEIDYTLPIYQFSFNYSLR